MDDTCQGFTETEEEKEGSQTRIIQEPLFPKVWQL